MAKRRFAADFGNSIAAGGRYETEEQRDTMLKHGAVAGAHAAFRQLADYLRTV